MQVHATELLTVNTYTKLIAK